MLTLSIALLLARSQHIQNMYPITLAIDLRINEQLKRNVIIFGYHRYFCPLIGMIGEAMLPMIHRKNEVTDCSLTKVIFICVLFIT